MLRVAARFLGGAVPTCQPRNGELASAHTSVSAVQPLPPRHARLDRTAMWLVVCPEVKLRARAHVRASNRGPRQTILFVDATPRFESPGGPRRSHFSATASSSASLLASSCDVRFQHAVPVHTLSLS